MSEEKNQKCQPKERLINECDLIDMLMKEQSDACRQMDRALNPVRFIQSETRYNTITYIIEEIRYLPSAEKEK